MSEEKASDFDFNRRIVGDDEDDIFKSAVEVRVDEKL